MSLDDLVGLLARLPAFAGMGRGPLMHIAQYAIPRYFEPGELLFSEGESGEAAYLVIYGSAIAVSELGTSREYRAGDLLGELAMITPVSHGFTCVAHSRLTVLEIARNLMHDLLQQDSSALDYTRSRIARRIEEIRGNLELLQQSLEASVIPGEARMEAAGSDAAFAAPGPAEAVFLGEGWQGEAQPAIHGLVDQGAPGAGFHGYDERLGEAGPAYGQGQPLSDEFARVLSVLGPIAEDADQIGQAPEYDRMELPSPWPRPPIAA